MAALVSNDAHFFLTTLLREVSRSFYLTLRVLPKQIRTQIGFAYLLARATDTIADTEVVAPHQRLHALARLREQILAATPGPVDLGELSACQMSEGEKLLLTRLDEILKLASQLPEDDLARIQKVLDTITSGQMLDLERFGHANARSIATLHTSEELDDYTWRVAGCVGAFWTDTCLAHLHPKPETDPTTLVARGIRYGKGLQLVNILRDIPADLQKGRCYLPLTGLQQLGLRPADLTDPQNEPALRPLYNQWLNLAHDHLAHGWSYVLDLPWRWTRLRLASSWPILIGLRTIDRLRTGNVLDPTHRIKVTRSQVRTILLFTTLLYPLPPLWNRLGPPRPETEAPPFE